MMTGNKITHSDGRNGTVRANGIVEDGEFEGEEFSVVRWDAGFTSQCLSKYLRPAGTPLSRFARTAQN